MNKNLLKIIVSFFVITSFILACKKDELEKNSINSFEKRISEDFALIKFRTRNFEFTYNSINNDINSKSDLVISNESFNETIELELNTNKTDYKLRSFQIVEIKANELKDKIPSSILLTLNEEYESFLHEIKSLITKDEYSQESLDLLYFYKGLFGTMIRHQESKECHCTPSPSYFVGKTKFFCMEDMQFDLNALRKYFDKNPKKLNDNGVKLLYNYVYSFQSNVDNIEYTKLFELEYSKKEFRDYLLNESLEVRKECLKGSDYGCCGNYSGCCWFSSYQCLMHDIECACCSKWHCGWACECDCKPQYCG
jgi:hypothetical protein